MSDNEGQSKAGKLDVQLNEAFERLEKKTDDRGRTIKTSKAPLVGSFLGIFLALVAIGMAGYAAWMVHRLPNVTNELQSVRGQLDAITERSRARGTRLEALSDELDRLRESRSREIKAIERQVDSAINEIKRSMGTSSEDWLMAEVEYLLRLANHRVLLQRDPKGAIALFEAADKIVKDAEGITAFALRNAIASDIAKLNSVRDVDIDGIFVKLSALKGLVGDLRQKELVYTPDRTEVSQTTVSADGVGEKALLLLEKAGARLADMVEFRSGGEKIKPVLPPEEEYYLRQNLILKLQLAQLALLRGDGKIFKDSLVEARQWVADNFSADDSVTEAVLNDIDEVMNVNIEREMPDTSGSLREVRKLLARFHQAEDSGAGQ